MLRLKQPKKTPHTNTDCTSIILKDISYIMDDTNTFDIMFSNTNLGINMADIDVDPKFCIGPLVEYNDSFKSLPNSCYLIYNNLITKTKTLLGFMSYNIREYRLIDMPTGSCDLYLSLSCVPSKFQSMGISSILRDIIISNISENPRINTIKSNIIATNDSQIWLGTTIANSIGLTLFPNTIDSYHGTMQKAIILIESRGIMQTRLQNLQQKLLRKSNKTPAKRKLGPNKSMSKSPKSPKSLNHDKIEEGLGKNNNRKNKSKTRKSVK